jgi:putative ABC transport system ATP-binding protein
MTTTTEHSTSAAWSSAAPVRTATPPSILELRGVTREYQSPTGTFAALDDLTISVTSGEFLAVVGESGSGKSTLLTLLAGIDRPTRGEIVIGGTPLNALTESALSAWRGQHVGIVFQFFQLLPTLTAAENVMMPMDFCDRYPKSERRARAERLLARLGVEAQRDKLPSTLSGGQQQRVAVARALANAPTILLADEPTGNLDSRTSDAMLSIFADLAREGQTIVMVTHEQRALRHATRVVTLADGRVISDRAKTANDTEHAHG